MTVLWVPSKKEHTVFISKEVVFVGIRKTQGCYLLFFQLFSFLKAVSRNCTSQDVRLKWIPKHLNKQKALSWGWSERNVAAQLVTSWDFGIIWFSTGKYQPVTFTGASLGNASSEVKNSWPDFMDLLVSLSIYLKNRNDDIWLVLTLSSRSVGDVTGSVAYFPHCFPFQCPYCSCPRNWYKARSPQPPGSFVGGI